MKGTLSNYMKDLDRIKIETDGDKKYTSENSYLNFSKYFELSEQNIYRNEKTNTMENDLLNFFYKIGEELKQSNININMLIEIQKEISKCVSNFDKITNQGQIDIDLSLKNSKILEGKITHIIIKMDKIQKYSNMIKEIWNCMNKEEKSLIPVPFPIEKEIINNIWEEIGQMENQCHNISMQEDRQEKTKFEANQEVKLAEILKMYKQLSINNCTEFCELLKEFQEFKKSITPFFVQYYHLTPEEYINQNPVNMLDLDEIHKNIEFMKIN